MGSQGTPFVLSSLALHTVTRATGMCAKPGISVSSAGHRLGTKAVGSFSMLRDESPPSSVSGLGAQESRHS